MATSPDTAPTILPEKVYAEIRTGIRETDAISFKLLGLVPLVSGAALITFIVQTRSFPPALIVLLALFSALITLGLFRWELRNIQTCSWLIKYGDALEARALAEKAMPEVFRPRPKPPQRIGKTEAEKLIYATTIFAWLGLPVGMNALPRQPFLSAYSVVAVLIVVATFLSVFARTRVPPVARDKPM